MPAPQRGRAPGDLRDLKVESAGREHEVLVALGIMPKGRGHVRCPFPDHEDRHPSWRWDARRVRWYCSCGTGDIFDAVQRMRGTDFVGAANVVRDVLGLPKPHLNETSAERAARERRLAEAQRRAGERQAARASEEAARDRDAIAAARRLWRVSRRAEGTPVPVYLDGRGIRLPSIPPSLRYLPANGVSPRMLPQELRGLAHRGELPHAMIAAIGTDLDSVHAVHLTLLRPDGAGKADVPRQKLIFGRPRGHSIVLGPPCDGQALAVAEGIETALSRHIATGLEPWAAGAASLMPGLADAVPGVIEAVTICAEPDEAGQRHARELATRLHARGMEVWL